MSGVARARCGFALAVRVSIVAALAVGAFSPVIAQDETWWLEFEGRGPGLHIVERDSTYEVSGFTHADIFREMQRNGPGSDEIGVRLGIHYSQWRWSFQYLDAPGQRCRLLDPTVLLRSSIVLPHWTNASTAPPEIAHGWRPFLDALRHHEDGHRSRAKAQGVFLWQSLLGLEAADCEALQRLAEEIAERIIAEGKEAQLEYDRETGHGMSQGAMWPPPGR